MVNVEEVAYKGIKSQELGDPKVTEFSEFYDPSGFYTELINALDEGESGIPELFALNHIYQYYYARVRLIQYNLGIEKVKANGLRSIERAHNKGDYTKIKNIDKRTSAAVDELKKRARSERVKIDNFAEGLPPFNDPTINARYKKIHTLWASKEKELGREELNRMKLKHPDAGNEKLAIGALMNIRETISYIRESHSAKNNRRQSKPTGPQS